MKNSFVLYSSYMEQINLLSMEQRGVLLTAIMAYEGKGEIPEMDGMTLMAFTFIKADLDRDAEKYQRTCEARRSAGLLGGRPKTKGLTENQTKAKKANGFSENQTEAKKPDNEYEYDNDLKEIPPKGGTKKSGFTPPTLQEVQEYIREKGYKVDAERFIDFYESKGWFIGKNKMKDWKAAVRTWVRRQQQEVNTKGRQETTANRFNNFQQRNYDFDELERKLTGRVT